jgi:3-hydroxyisobutyrate dehydrogenase-like beta-hydroxyacid dehydrogenase
MASEIGPVGFVRSGTIGAPMARRLLDAGHALVVCDRVEAAAAPLRLATATGPAQPERAPNQRPQSTASARPRAISPPA